MKHLRPLLAAALLFGCSQDPAPGPAAGRDFCAEVERGAAPGLSLILEPLAPQMAASTGVYVLEDGAGAMMARAWLSEYAEKTIDVQYFIFSADNVGLIAADQLVRAAERGVRVRILVDDMLVEADADQLLAIDQVPNLEIRIYNPGMKVGTSLPRKLFNVATDFRGINQRMHNKTFTVDGKVTITGGRNIADEYFDYDHEYNFRDRDVLLLGGVTAEVQKSFEQFWNDPLSLPVADLTQAARPEVGAEERIAGLHQYACNPENYWPEVRALLADIPAVFERILATGELQWVEGVTFVTDQPGKNSGREGLGGGSPTLEALEKLFRQAKKRVTIETPYLITTEASREIFREATERGVEVRILTNSLASTDNLEAFNGYQRDREALLETGAKIFEFRPDAAIRAQIMKGALAATLKDPPIFALHAKSMVIDGKVTVIGTFNLDPRSANLNTECLVAIPSERIAASVLEGMEANLEPENAWETTPTFHPDAEAGWKKRFKSWTRGVVPKRIL
jgi:putative cardiolipin synthase